MNLTELGVLQYLQADRQMFVNGQCLLQLDEKELKSRHWYVDAVAVSLRHKQVYLCEITYAKSMADLLRRLASWGAHWEDVQAALRLRCGLDPTFAIRPWIFIPNGLIPDFRKRLQTGVAMPVPRITALEDTSEWNYDPHLRVDEGFES